MRPDAGHVGARVGLGDAERADLLALDRRHEPALLLVLGPELPDRRCGDVHVTADRSTHAARAAARQLLCPDRVVQVAAALAAVALLVLQPEEAQLAAAQEDLVWHPLRVLPLHGIGTQLGLDEAPQRLPQL